MTSLFDWAESSDGRTDKALARETVPTVGVAAFHAEALAPRRGDQAGVGSEWSSPSETMICVCGKTAMDGVRCRFGASHQALDESKL